MAKSMFRGDVLGARKRCENLKLVFGSIWSCSLLMDVNHREAKSIGNINVTDFLARASFRRLVAMVVAISYD